MPDTQTETSQRGILVSLRAAVNAAALVGCVAGALEGAWVAAGIDSAVFVERAKGLGLLRAIRTAHRAWDSFGGMAGCIATTMLAYAGLAFVLYVALSFAGHPWLRRRDLQERYRLYVALGLGLWLGAELFWWTRPLVFSGLPMTSPRKLLVLAVAMLLGLFLGRLLERAGRRAPYALRSLSPILCVAALIGGTYFLAHDTRKSESLGEPVARTAGRPNVLVFIVDALRQDVLGCYGNERVQTPNIDRLAREGVVFEDAFAQAPFTWTSFGSFLTGKYPRRHGLLKMAPGARLAENITLASWLKQAPCREGGALAPSDYVTGAFMTGTVSHGSGLLQGFDSYFEALVGHDLVDVHSQWSRFRSALLPWLVRNKLVQRFDQRVVANEARAWLSEHVHDRFGALVHFYSTHTPYDPEDEFRGMYVDPAYSGPIRSFWAAHREAIERGEYTLTPADAEQIRNLYYGGVSMADAMIGEVLAALEQRGVLDETIVVVTSDHGEELGDHGLWEHNFMYGTNLRIPLVIRYPQRLPAGTRVEAPVDSIDLLPTICDLLEIEPPSDPAAGERGLVDGRSLLPLVRGEETALRPYTFAENGVYLSIQGGGWKLVLKKSLLEGGFEALSAVPAGELPELYDLARDPAEREDRFAAEPERARTLYEALRQWSESLPIPRSAFAESERDVEDAEVLRRILQETGYGGGVGEEDE